MILKCTCEQSYQDEQYGKGNRLHNWDEKTGKWLCSVCGNDKESPDKPKAKAKK